MHTLKTCWFSKLTQSRLVPIQIHGQSELDWGSFWKRKCLFSWWRVWVRAGWWWWCVFVGLWVCCMEVTGFVEGCVGRWGWMCVWGCGWVGEWVLDKWHSLYANTNCKHEYSVLNSIRPKVEWVILENKTKHSSFVSVIYKLTRKSNKQLERTNEQTNKETT